MAPSRSATRPRASVTLDAEALKEIEEAVPAGAAAGERYAAPMMATLDSER